MKVVCAASTARGHLDFGGMGYVNLARTLIARGHELEWISTGSQVGRLRERNFTAHDKDTRALLLQPFVPADRLDASPELHARRIDGLKSLAADLATLRPDVLIFDRLLAYGPMLTERLGIPYACIGTPGGYWTHDGTYVQPAAGPVKAYHDLEERLRMELHWKGSSQASFWAHSPALNISFTGISFYGSSHTGAPCTAFVNNFTDLPIPEGGDRVGISFGNTGAAAVLGFFIQCAMDNALLADPIDVFSGNQQDVYAALEAAFPSRNLHVHKWVDFGDYFSRLRYLVFFGGLGTLWQSLNHYLPMLVVPGLAGDQALNAERVSALSLGSSLFLNRNDCSLVASAIHGMNHRARYLDSIIAYRRAANFTDTIESACDRLEALAVRR
ncbi:MAG: hypothetical protein ACLPTM_02650 [Steroidobacteraceae bacterium]